MIKVLVADDKASSRELIREMLEGPDYEVEEAANGVEVLAKAYASRPDILLLDIQMPLLDGFGVLAEMRRDPELSRIPVIALTANAMAGDRERGLRAGFHSYLTKPVDFMLLHTELERLAAQHRPAGEEA